MTQPSGSNCAASHLAGIRFDNLHAVRAELCYVTLRCRMLPHDRVHRWSDHHWSCASQIGRTYKVIGDAIGEFGQRVGGRRRDDEKVDRLRKGDVSNWIGIIGGVIVNYY